MSRGRTTPRIVDPLASTSRAVTGAHKRASAIASEADVAWGACDVAEEIYLDQSYDFQGCAEHALTGTEIVLKDDDLRLRSS
jgi:hypothetical protein